MLRKMLSTGAVVLALLGTTETSIAATAKDQGGPVTSFYGVNGGPIDPFYGSVNPFYGAVNQNYGHINPFWGDISSFWGNINPFYGAIRPFYGNIDQFWGAINPFNANTFDAKIYSYWNSAGPQWGDINTLWNQLQASNATDYSQLQSALNSFLANAVAFWGSPAQTTATQLETKYAINPNDAASLAATTPEARAAFFLNFYDLTMNLSKLDHVDWWMAAIGWSPAVVLSTGPGTAHAGELDAFTSHDNSDTQNLKVVGGYTKYVNDHGAAVASLMAGMEDKLGVMGVAPKSQILLYNPFDATGTASWTDVTSGINKLYSQMATVMNASLGVPGWVLSKEWGGILTSSAVNNNKHYFVLVKAAGNEGVVQSTDITWPAGFSAPSNLLMVGSIGPTGQISSFSNTPGESCLLVNGACQEQNKLKYRYLVAPGELMLVENNHNSITRMTGTSFAAPLVTGTIALVQTRWPWLVNYADETVQIILQSATDLGDPGVDPAYGWGMLNSEAAMSPLDFNNISVFKPYTFNGKAVSVDRTQPNWTPASLKAAILTSGQLATWDKQKAFLVAYENIGTTYRDFLIPLSSALVGKSQNVNGATRPFQSYIYQRLLNWAQSAPQHSTAAHMSKRLRSKMRAMLLLLR